MKALDNQEFTQIVIALQTLVGAQLQEVWQSDSEVGLGFYHERKIHWLWFDLNPRAPMILQFFDRPPIRPKQTKPLLLFIKAHFVGKRLLNISTQANSGRILTFEFFSTEEPHAIEVRLFPHGANILPRAGKRQVSLFKVQESPEGAFQVSQHKEEAHPSRSWDEIQAEWQAENLQGPGKAGGASQKTSAIERAEHDWQRQIEKKQSALGKMQADLERKKQTSWSELGEWLKVHQTTDLPSDAPSEWRELIHRDESFAWNIENCFKKAKSNARKLGEAEQRITQVRDEILKLQSQGPRLPTNSSPQTKKKTLLEAADVRGRQFKPAPDLDAYIGKSGADNLALLRKAQAFDYWLHLRDHPGAHAILRRTRTRNVTDAEFQHLGRWVVQESLHKSAEQLKGEHFDMLIVECRYVRPIKGDKLGRVNYKNDRVMSIHF
jgi:predicted ribosome quality control (RQC) complex YloA/Tae2 family protein